MWNADPEGSATRAIKKGAMRETERRVLRDRFVAQNGKAAMEIRHAHHMIPMELLDDREIATAVKRASKANWDYSDPNVNGAIAKQYHGPHAQYNADVKEWLKREINDRKVNGGLTTDAEYASLLAECVNYHRPLLGSQYDLLP